MPETENVPAWERAWQQAAELHGAGDLTGALESFEQLLWDPELPSDRVGFIRQNVMTIRAELQESSGYNQIIRDASEAIDRGEVGNAHERMAALIEHPLTDPATRANLCINLMLTGAILGDADIAIEWLDSAAAAAQTDVHERASTMLRGLLDVKPEVLHAISDHLRSQGLDETRLPAR